MNTVWQPGVTLEQLEKAAILKAYGFFGQNKTRTAQALDISVRTLDAKLAKYDGRELPPEVVQATAPIPEVKVKDYTANGKHARR